MRTWEEVEGGGGVEAGQLGKLITSTVCPPGDGLPVSRGQTRVLGG